MFKQEVPGLLKLNIDNQVNNEELEQCGRHLCLRIDGVLLSITNQVMIY